MVEGMLHSFLPSSSRNCVACLSLTLQVSIAILAQKKAQCNLTICYLLMRRIKTAAQRTRHGNQQKCFPEKLETITQSSIQHLFLLKYNLGIQFMLPSLPRVTFRLLRHFCLRGEKSHQCLLRKLCAMHFKTNQFNIALCRDGLADKSTSYFSRRPKFSSQHLHSS